MVPQRWQILQRKFPSDFAMRIFFWLYNENLDSCYAITSTAESPTCEVKGILLPLVVPLILKCFIKRLTWPFYLQSNHERKIWEQLLFWLTSFWTIYCSCYITYTSHDPQFFTDLNNVISCKYDHYTKKTGFLFLYQMTITKIIHKFLCANLKNKSEHTDKKYFDQCMA